jgi:Ca-activated chloride channel family protein
MSFDRPYFLVALLVVPAAIAVYLLAERRRMRYSLAFTNLDVLASVVGRTSAWRRYVPLALVLLALTAAAAALARPTVETLIPREEATVVLVVDVSGSMYAEDVKPSRLAAAQEAVRTFLDKVPKKVRVGLIVFAAEPQIATPPTTDRDLVRQAVDTLGGFPAGGRGTAIGDALAAAVKMGQQAIGVTDDGQGQAQTIALTTLAADASDEGALGPVSILFLSDGSQTRGVLQPLEGAGRAKAAGIPVFTVALGTPEGVITRGFGGFGFDQIPVPPDPATLSAIAEETGGRFFEAQSAEALESAYSRLGSSLGRVPGSRDISALFLAVAAATLVGAGVLSALWSPRLP